MFSHKRRGVVVAWTLAATMFAGPMSADASWFGDLFGRRTTYRPVTAYYPAPAACGQTVTACRPCVRQVYRYVPQTCYRTVCVNVPVRTYRPVTTRDPCTGCCRTCYRPVTTYVRQARRVPYTTYRPVLMNVHYRPQTCATCPTGGVVAAAPGCATGGCAPAATMSSPPIATTNPLAPRTQVMPNPSLPSTGPSGQSTFRLPTTSDPTPPKPDESSVKKLHESHHPIQSLRGNGRAAPPVSPGKAVGQDRFTWALPRHDWAFTPVSWPAPTNSRDARRAPLDDEGWVSARN